MQMQQSNMNNQSMKQSNVPPRQSGVHQSSANNSIKSNQFQQSTQLSKKSNIPPNSKIQSQMQQSNMTNKYNQSSTKNSLPSYHESQFQLVFSLLFSLIVLLHFVDLRNKIILLLS